MWMLLESFNEDQTNGLFTDARKQFEYTIAMDGIFSYVFKVVFSNLNSQFSDSIYLTYLTLKLFP